MTSATLTAPTPRCGDGSVVPLKDPHPLTDAASADGGPDAATTPSAEDDASLLKPLSSPDADFDPGAYAGRVLAEATSSEEV